MWESLCALFSDPETWEALGKGAEAIFGMSSGDSSGGGVMSSNLMSGVGKALKGVGALGLAGNRTPAPQAHSSPFHYQSAANPQQVADKAAGLMKNTINPANGFKSLKNLF